MRRTLILLALLWPAAAPAAMPAGPGRADCEAAGRACMAAPDLSGLPPARARTRYPALTPDPAPAAGGFTVRAFMGVLLATPQLAGFALVDPAAAPEPLRSRAMVWRTEGTLGAISEPIDAPWTAHRAEAERILAADRARCAGTFEFGMRVEFLDLDSPLLRAFAECRAAGETAHVQYLLLSIRDRRMLRIEHRADAAAPARRAGDLLLRALRDVVARTHAR